MIPYEWRSLVLASHIDHNTNNYSLSIPLLILPQNLSILRVHFLSYVPTSLDFFFTATVFERNV